MSKNFWTPEEVCFYLKSIKKGNRLKLPVDAYCTENFTWNEVLQTNERNIDLPSLNILENLKSSADVLQVYRNIIGKPIKITSGWRTPTEQNRLISAYNRHDGSQVNKPSATSLHLEGLALDFSVQGSSQKSAQDTIDTVHMGEMEFGSNYTHIGLPTFSKGYLIRNGLDCGKFYRKLNAENINFSQYERQKIIKRMDATNWLSKPSKFDVGKNTDIFKNSNINLLNYQSDVEPEFSLAYKVFTREELANMSSIEYEKYKGLIDLQMANFDIPSSQVAEELVSLGDLIWVDSYCRKNGVVVKGYYRHI